MSGVGDDRWRGGRGYAPGQGQRHQGGGYRDRQSGSHQQQDRHGHRSQPNNVTATAAWAGPSPSGPSREPHIPVRGFNSAELKDALRKDYRKGGQGEPQPVVYRPIGKDGNPPARPSGPWGSKPNSMANGKDFFLELRKQVSGLQQSNVQGG